VYARNLADHAVQLALILEDALSMAAEQVKHFMVGGVIPAEEFHERREGFGPDLPAIRNRIRFKRDYHGAVGYNRG
jgi:hypothetical protein